MSQKNKQKQNNFTFQAGKIGRIPSKYKSSEKESYSKFLVEFGSLIDDKLHIENQNPTKGSVYVFISQLLKSESEFKTCDVDNMVKSVLELLTDRCYFDDGQVTSLLIAKELQEKPIDDFYFIGVKYLAKSNDPGNLHKEGLFEAKRLYSELSS